MYENRTSIGIFSRRCPCLKIQLLTYLNKLYEWNKPFTHEYILKNTISKYMSKHIVLDSQFDAFNSVVRIFVVFLVMRKKSSKLSKVIKSTFSTLIFICIMTSFNILDKRDFKFRGVSSWSRSPVYQSVGLAIATTDI